MTQQNFLSNESGAVTVDWVVLTAALVGLGLAVMAVVSGGVEDLSGDVNTQLTDGSIIRTGFTGNAAAVRDAACGAYGACDDTLTADALKGLTGTEFGNVQNVTYGDDVAANLTASGLELDADSGSWGTRDINGDFTANEGATTQFNTAAAAQASQNALIASEAAARAN